MIKDNIISRYTVGFLLPMLLVLFMTSPAMAVSTLAVFSGGPPPAINCPADITQDNDPGTCWAVVTYIPPANATLISGMPSGSTFPVGTTTNIFKANGDTATCSFTVTVVDTEPPIMTCPGNISKSYDAGLCQAVYYTTPVAIDNCPSVMVYQLTGLPSGSVFPAGQTTNTFQAVDAAGNTATCSFTITIGSGHVTVLPGDGSVSGDLAPQGAVRYQRQLLLVTPSEAGVSGLTNGMIVNSAGFTFASAQNDTVQGRFKLYLQNTPDTESRMDTVWTTATSTSPSYNATGLAPGIYEWQVSAVCPGSPDYSDPVVFENDNLSGCNQPYNLSTDPVTYNSATFHWECAGSARFQQL